MKQIQNIVKSVTNKSGQIKERILQIVGNNNNTILYLNKEEGKK